MTGLGRLAPIGPCDAAGTENALEITSLRGIEKLFVARHESGPTDREESRLQVRMRACQISLACSASTHREKSHREGFQVIDKIEPV